MGGPEESRRSALKALVVEFFTRRSALVLTLVVGLVLSIIVLVKIGNHDPACT